MTYRRKIKLCEGCGEEIFNRQSSAKYCKSCADKKHHREKWR